MRTVRVLGNTCFGFSRLAFIIMAFFIFYFWLIRFGFVKSGLGPVSLWVGLLSWATYEIILVD